jgi:hypothetical protein
MFDFVYFGIMLPLRSLSKASGVKLKTVSLFQSFKPEPATTKD